MYLAEKTGQILRRWSRISATGVAEWVMWQMGGPSAR